MVMRGAVVVGLQHAGDEDRVKSRTYSIWNRRLGIALLW
jgi:hypothetical protein